MTNNNEMPDEIWASNQNGTGNTGVWSRYETPHIYGGKGGKIIKSTRKTRFPRIKYIRADKAVPEGWKLVPIEPTEEMVKEGTLAAMSAMYGPVVKGQLNGMVSQMTFSCVPEYKAMLSAAPQPPTKGD